MNTKLNFIYGLLLAALFTTFIILLPHKTFRVQGIESDLGYYYIPMARELATSITGDEPYANREYTWQFHGPVYPLLLLAGRKVIGPDTDWGYFIWAKWYSALAGGSIILLAFVWLGIPQALLAALSLALTSLFVECAFSCGTDLLPVAILLWSVFILHSGSSARWKTLLSGLLFAFCVDMRHEFVVLLPFVLLYLWRKARSNDDHLTVVKRRSWWGFKHPSSPLLFLIPFLLLVAPDMPNWNGTYNAAYKYKSGEARWQDLWPQEAYTDAKTDDLNETYWGYLIRKSDERYPSLLSVLIEDPIENAGIWIRDITRGFRDIPGVWVLPFLSIAFVINLARTKPTRMRLSFNKICFAAVAFHFLMITSFGVYVDRYYLLEIIALTFAGSVALFKLLPTGRRGTLALLITLPFFYLGSLETGNAITRNIRFSGDRFIRYREIVTPEEGQHHAIFMSRDPGIPYVAGAEWHQFPKGVSNLHKYCIERGIRYLYWGSREAAFRSEYAEIFDYPDKTEPEFTLVDRKTGLLYYVNEVEDIEESGIHMSE